MNFQQKSFVFIKLKLLFVKNEKYYYINIIFPYFFIKNHSRSYVDVYNSMSINEFNSLFFKLYNALAYLHSYIFVLKRIHLFNKNIAKVLLIEINRICK